MFFHYFLWNLLYFNCYGFFASGIYIFGLILCFFDSSLYFVGVYLCLVFLFFHGSLLILDLIFDFRYLFFMRSRYFAFNYIYYNSGFMISLELCFFALFLLRVESLMELF